MLPRVHREAYPPCTQGGIPTMYTGRYTTVYIRRFTPRVYIRRFTPRVYKEVYT